MLTKKKGISRIKLIPKDLNLNDNLEKRKSGYFEINMKKRTIDIRKQIEGIKYLVTDGTNLFAVSFQFYDECKTIFNLTQFD